MVNTAVILAAGRGGRLYRISQYFPKCLLEIDNKPIIEESIEKLRDMGIGKAESDRYNKKNGFSNIREDVTTALNTTRIREQLPSRHRM